MQRPPQPISRRWPALAAILLLAPGVACSGSSPSEPGGTGPSPASVEASAYSRINQSRRDAGVGELFLDPVLGEVARAYSERMRDEGFFGHQDPAGGGLVERLDAAGVSFSIAGENLAHVSGEADPAARAHQLLMGNPDHRANILDGRFTEIGVGVARSGDTFWMTQIFLRP